MLIVHCGKNTRNHHCHDLLFGLNALWNWPASLNRLFHRTKPLPSITRMRELGPTQLADDSWENALYYAHMLANGYNNYKM